MKIITLTRNDVLASNCYIVESGQFFSVIDPSVSYADAILSAPELKALKPRYVILTHAHIDHFWEIGSYVEMGCEVLVSSADAEKLNDGRTNLSFFITGPLKAYSGKYSAVSEGEKIDIGEEELTVIETPGHTSGSITLIGGGIIFSGDTLFSGGAYGRYDFPSGNAGMLAASIKRILSYNSSFDLLSGHGDKAKLEEIKKYFDI